MSTIQAPSTTTAGGMPHYVALDSWRGICACAVILYHLPSTGTLTSLRFFENAWLFVDLFFVLSGFVIAASYGDRLANGYSVRRFMTLRLGRVYPLHFAILMVFLAFEIVKMALGHGENAAFTGNSPPGALLTNLTLTQIFGFHDKVMWNSPAWSIAAEVWTYLIAAVGLVLLRGRFRWVLVATAIAMPLYLASVDGRGLDRTFDMALERCLYGFSLGMLAHSVHRTGRFLPTGRATATLLEVTLGGAMLLLVGFAPQGRLDLLFPPLFALVVYVYAGDAGAVSRVMAAKPFRLLGALSYSIYMMHILVIGRFMGISGLAGRALGITTTKMADYRGGPSKVLAGEGLLPDVQVVLCVMAVVAAAWFSYRFIEIPCRDWSRRIAKRVGGERSSLQPATGRRAAGTVQG